MGVSGVEDIEGDGEDAAALCINFIVSSLEDMVFGVPGDAILSVRPSSVVVNVQARVASNNLTQFLPSSCEGKDVAV